jgi:hypothetical protein
MLICFCDSSQNLKAQEERLKNRRFLFITLIIYHIFKSISIMHHLSNAIKIKAPPMKETPFNDALFEEGPVYAEVRVVAVPELV